MAVGDAATLSLREAEVSEPITPADSGPSKKPMSGEQHDRPESRLTDQNFNIKKYPDPLLPRRGSDSRHHVNGVTHEMEQKWLAQIEASRLGKGDQL